MIAAGDPAPAVRCTRVLQPRGADWAPTTLAGHPYVVCFWNNDPREDNFAAYWNDFVRGFAGEPVQFVWITQNTDPSLEQWLTDNPVQGWMLYDPDGATAGAYDMDMLGTVMVDAAHHVAGFPRSSIPTTFDVRALLDGNTDAVSLLRAPRRRPRKPNVVPSNVPYVTRTKQPEGSTSGASLEDFWTLEGVTLPRLVADLWDVPESRLDIASTLDTWSRYDVALVPPRQESSETLRLLMREGIAKRFGIDVVTEVRPMDVFVLTAPHGIAGNGELHGGGFMSTYSDLEIDASSVEEARELLEERMKAMGGREGGLFGSRGKMSASGSCTTEHLCRMLEGMLDRLVVDEAGAVDGFDFNITAEGGVDGFLETLRTHTGIEVTPARRDVKMLVVRPV